MSGRDDERAAVYAAEEAAFAGTDLEVVTTLAALVDGVAVVAAGRWWAGPPITVRAARRDARASTTRCSNDGATIRIAADQSTWATLAHELAHALAGSERGHDAVFRAAYLDTVATVTNIDPTDRRHGLHVGQLAAAFAAAGLDVAERRWPPPTGGDAIAL
ncbi:MAG: hypothetical protein ACR2O6_13560 [Ilumatobacteraceae bacterium]